MIKIIVIEDEQSIRHLIADILRDEGYQVLTAHHGQEGIELIQKELPNLIICDIMMPKLSGYDVLQVIRSNPETLVIPFIFLTAKGSKEDTRQGMELGADDYLSKPFSHDSLLGAVKSRLEHTQSLEIAYRQQLDELRSNIASALPHELRTPLTGILSSVGFLKMDFDNLEKSEIIDLLDCIETSGKRLYQLIQRYLLYIELESNLNSPNKQQLLEMRSVYSMQQEIERSTHALAQKYQRLSDLSLDLEDALVQINDYHCQELLTETIDNAFKFSNTGMPVQLVGKIQDNYYILDITNQGRGMTAEQIRKIGAYIQFDRHKHEQQGSGLGLAIAQRIIKYYKGSMEIQNHQGTTTIQLKLPIAKEILYED